MERIEIPCLDACVVGNSVEGRCDTAFDQEGIRYEEEFEEGAGA
jgi:hypothetical protein